MESVYLIPSYKRATKIKTTKLIEGCILCVHEFEAHEYKSHNKGEVFILPDNLKGNKARCVNYLLEKFKDSKYIVLLDDDLDGIGYFEGKQRFIATSKEIRAKMDELYSIAKEMKSTLFGVNITDSKWAYKEYYPFSFNVPILHPFAGIIPTELRLDETLSLNDDYDFFIQSYLRDGKCVRLNKWHYYAEHLTNDGGCSVYRTDEKERAQAELMIKKWGDIVSYNFERGYNPRIILN